MTRASPIGLLIILAFIVSSNKAFAQILVFPQRANQSRVNYYDLEWRSLELEIGPKEGRPGAKQLSQQPGNIRLFFYESAREVAELAAPSIQESYRYLVDEFDYVPEEQFPYFLYNHYLQFVETNLFPVQIGVLGVTSPVDLTMAVPYFGDHQKFHRVSTHELIHQFMSQKLRSLHENKFDVDVFQALPLWFVEGMAEYYTWRGLDDETKMLITDLINHPNPEEGFYFKSFFQTFPGSFFGVYKLGQARVAFLEHQYGKGTTQKILERSARLREQDFKDLVEHVTGNSAETITAKFERWVKNFSYSHYLAAKQHEVDLDLIRSIEGQMLGLASSPDGKVLMYKAAQMHTGQTELFLMEGQAPYKSKKVASDQQPGLLSLHPEESQTFAVTDGQVAFFGVVKGQDALYVQEYKEAKSGFELGDRRVLHLRQKGIFAAQSPVFSPNGQSLAFVGFDKEGQRDIFHISILAEDFVIRRLTDNVYSERALAWGRVDQLIYTSDATSGGTFNLFEINPQSQEIEPAQLTFIDSDVLSPLVTEEGRLFFVRLKEGVANLFEVTEEDGAGKFIRRTQVDTGLLSLSQGRENGLWALYQMSGKLWPAYVSAKQLLDEPADSFQLIDGDPYYPLPRHSLSEASDYQPFAARNWEMGQTFALLGGGFGGIAGQVVTSAHDQLRNHSVNMNLFINGSFEYSDGQLFYTNSEGRWIWGSGIFQSIGVRSERTPDKVRFSSIERFSGVAGILRYPFSRFFYTQGQLSTGPLDRGLTDWTEDALKQQYGSFVKDWKRENADTDFQTELGLGLGYNSLRYHPFTGPYSGSSLLLQGVVDYLHKEDYFRSRIRLDGEHFVPLSDWTNLFFRIGAGRSFSARRTRDYYLSSTYTLRPVPTAQERFLLGRQFLFSTTELQFPLQSLIRVPLFNLEGVLGMDFGGAGDSWKEMWNYRVLGAITGVNFTLRPLVLRLHFAKPIPIGAEAIPNDGDWVSHFSLSYMYD